MAYDEVLAERVRRVLAGRDDITERKMMSPLCFMAGNQLHGIVTASIGMGYFDAAVLPEDAFRAVDDALYRVRALGRNQVVNA